MRVVVQLERIGDVVQSIPAVRTAAAGDRPCALLVREGLGGWARLLVPDGVRVLELPDAPLTRVRAELARDRRSPAVLEAARAARDALGIATPTSVVSLTWNAPGAAVAAALADSAAERRGPMRDAHGRTTCHGFWSLYPVAAVDARPAGCVHMTDVRRLIVEEIVGARLPDARREPPRRPSKRDGIAVLVAGASDDARVWPAEHFARVARDLAALGIAPVLAGGPGDVERAAAIAASSGGAARSLAGRLAPSGLAALFDEASVVIGADTGPVHLASWLGAPTVMLMSGRAHAWETGPVRPGDVVLQALPPGRGAIGAIGPELVVAGARALLGIGGMPRGTGGVDVGSAGAAGAGDPLGGTVYRFSRDADGRRVPRRLLARLAGAPPSSGLLPPEQSRSPRACGEGTCAAARTARVRAAGALDEAARGDGPACREALTRAQAALEDAAARLGTDPALAAVAAMIRLLTAEATHLRAPARATRLATLAIDLENALTGVSPPRARGSAAGLPA